MAAKHSSKPRTTLAPQTGDVSPEIDVDTLQPCIAKALAVATGLCHSEDEQAKHAAAAIVDSLREAQSIVNAAVGCAQMGYGLRPEEGIAKAGANPVPIKELRELRDTAAFRLVAAAGVVETILLDVTGDGPIDGAMYAVSYLLKDVQDAVDKMDEHLPEPTEAEVSHS